MTDTESQTEPRDIASLKCKTCRAWVNEEGHVHESYDRLRATVTVLQTALKEISKLSGSAQAITKARYIARAALANATTDPDQEGGG